MGDSERRDTPFRVPINRETCRGHPDGHRDEGGWVGYRSGLYYVVSGYNLPGRIL